MRKSKRLIKKFYLAFISISMVLVLIGCQSITPPPPEAIGEIPPDSLSVSQQIQEALRLSDPVARREAVLAATEMFLRDGTVRQRDDAAISKLLTEIAFQSEQLVLSDPAFVRRQGTLVVVGLPDGLGLFLFDLSAPPDSHALQLSSWTIGLSSVEVTWAGNEFGVSYSTVDSKQVPWKHYVMGSKSEAVWQVTWFSDEQPDWWFNARNATIFVAPYLSRLTVIGEATGSTSVFTEDGTFPLRTFKVEWLRDHDHYRLTPTTESQKDRQNWLWQTAQPSAYATLVEFIEHVRLRDSEEANHLASEPSVVKAAFSFGLHLPDDRYKIIAHDLDSITFQGQQGAFVATFEAPVSEEAPWLIMDLQPLGAFIPTSTPQPQ